MHFDTGGTQHGKALAAHQWIGVLHGGHYAADTGINQGLGAGAGAAGVAARLQCDISGGAVGVGTGLAQGMHFGVRLTGAQVKALAHDLAAVGNHAAHARVGAGRKPPLPSEVKGGLHQPGVGGAKGCHQLQS